MRWIAKCSGCESWNSLKIAKIAGMMNAGVTHHSPHTPVLLSKMKDKDKGPLKIGIAVSDMVWLKDNAQTSAILFNGNVRPVWQLDETDVRGGRIRF